MLWLPSWKKKSEGRCYFYLKEDSSPTSYNLRSSLIAAGWRERSWGNQFKTKNLNFSPSAAETLEYKHLLAKLITKHCPELMPLSLEVNDQTWPKLLSFLYENKLGETWILKPALLNNGQGLKIFCDLEALEVHFLNSQRLGGPHVLQQYILHPHLLSDKRKYSLRFFLILTNYMGNYFYPQGYFNVAKLPYDPNDFKDLRPHLTNEHLEPGETNVIQIPSDQFKHYPHQLEPQIQHGLEQLVLALKCEYPQAFKLEKQKKLSFFGVDFMVDHSGRVWLLEVNHGPCFPTAPEHPLQEALYQPFWRHVVTCFIERFVDSSSMTFEVEPFISLDKD